MERHARSEIRTHADLRPPELESGALDRSAIRAIRIRGSIAFASITSVALSFRHSLGRYDLRAGDSSVGRASDCRRRRYQIVDGSIPSHRIANDADTKFVSRDRLT